MVLLRSSARERLHEAQRSQFKTHTDKHGDKIEIGEGHGDLMSTSLVLSRCTSSAALSEECGGTNDDGGGLDGALRVHTDTCINALPGLLSIAFLASLAATARHDVSLKVAAAAHDATFKAKGCQLQYDLNQCTHSVPRMLTDCNDWQACMLAPQGIPVSRFAAQTAAECLNAFVEPLSYKAAAVLVVALWTIFSSLRSAFAQWGTVEEHRQGQHHPHQALAAG